jgi:hypothetical protein
MRVKRSVASALTLLSEEVGVVRRKSPAGSVGSLVCWCCHESPPPRCLNATRTVQNYSRLSQLLVGHEGLFSFVRPDADQRNAKVVGQKPDRVQNNTLFTERASQYGCARARKHKPIVQ